MTKKTPISPDTPPIPQEGLLLSLSQAVENNFQLIRQAKEALDSWCQQTNPGVGELAVTMGAARLLKDWAELLQKEVDGIYSDLNEKRLPEAFMSEGGTTKIANKYGTIYLTQRRSASIADKEKAYKWLRDNGLGDLIVNHVFPQTLQASLAKLAEEQGLEPPPEVIKSSSQTVAQIIGRKKPEHGKTN